MTEKQKRINRKGLSITAHKGGRSEWFKTRLTPDEKTLIASASKAEGKSQSDFIMGLVRKHVGQD